MGSTPKYGLRYPEQTDGNDVATHMRTLASDVEAGLQQAVRIVPTVFAASGTWVKPTGALWVEVQLWGGGGPGSPGHSMGSAGGSGAERATVRIPAAALPATVAVIVGAGGTFPTDGGPGTDGGTSSFGDYVRARGGGAPVLRDGGNGSQYYYGSPGAGVIQIGGAYGSYQPDDAGGGATNSPLAGGAPSMFGGGQGGGGSPTTAGRVGGGTGVNGAGGGDGGTAGSLNGQPGANKTGPSGGGGGGQGAQSGGVSATVGGNGGAGGIPGGGGGGGAFGGQNGLSGASNGLSGPGGRGEVRVYVICAGK